LGDKFVFEILEVVKTRDDSDFKLSDELALLEEIWLEKLQPFGEKGYNPARHIRQAWRRLILPLLSPILPPYRWCSCRWDHLHRWRLP